MCDISGGGEGWSVTGEVGGEGSARKDKYTCYQFARKFLLRIHHESGFVSAFYQLENIYIHFSRLAATVQSLGATSMRWLKFMVTLGKS